MVCVLPLLSNADPAALFPLEFSHPLRSSILSCAVALEQCSVFSLEPQTRVFGYTPVAAKGKTHSSVHIISEENISSLAAVGITPIISVESLTRVGVFQSGVLRGAREGRYARRIR